MKFLAFLLVLKTVFSRSKTQIIVYLVSLHFNALCPTFPLKEFISWRATPNRLQNILLPLLFFFLIDPKRFCELRIDESQWQPNRADVPIIRSSNALIITLPMNLCGMVYGPDGRWLFGSVIQVESRLTYFFNLH